MTRRTTALSTSSGTTATVPPSSSATIAVATASRRSQRDGSACVGAEVNHHPLVARQNPELVRACQSPPTRRRGIQVQLHGVEILETDEESGRGPAPRERLRRRVASS